MAVSVLAVAKRMGEQSGWRLTNLALQKLCYIAHMLHLGQHGEALVFGQFQAWDLGPVHPQLYRAVSRFGSSPVQAQVFESVRSVQDDTVITTLIDRVVNELSDNTPRLVAITHWEGGAWAKHYVPDVKHIMIPDEDILQEYKDRQLEPQK
ncbi:MAG: DUF4065 domain-containing protein [Boseongicola sp. SB0675_bin_26]|nr:DUF4065 domain-containing protein [Boseongicola sp. SB0675_bin_26]